MNPLAAIEGKIAVIVAAACLLGGFLSGYKVADWRLTAKANGEALERSQRAEKARDEAIAAYTHLAGELSAANDKHTNELRSAQDETNRTRDRLNAGVIGLRIAGTCPRIGEAQSAPGTRVDTGTGAELDSIARRAYFALRDGIDRASAQLAACQDELRLRAAPQDSQSPNPRGNAQGEVSN